MYGTQTKWGSFVEAWGNVAVGFAINFTANWLILPRFGFTNLTLLKNFEIGLAFTVISVARSFILRRWFNRIKFGNINKHASELEVGKEEKERIPQWIGRVYSGVSKYAGDRIRVRKPYSNVSQACPDCIVPSVRVQKDSSKEDIYT